MASSPPPIVRSRDVAKAMAARMKDLQAEVTRQANAITDDPLKQAKLVNAFKEVPGILQKHDNGDQAMSTSPHAMASVLQSFVQEKAAEAGQVDHTGLGPFVRFSDLDLIEWIRTGFIGLFEGQDRFEWKTAPDDPDPLPNPG